MLDGKLLQNHPFCNQTVKIPRIYSGTVSTGETVGFAGLHRLSQIMNNLLILKICYKTPCINEIFVL